MDANDHERTANYCRARLRHCVAMAESRVESPTQHLCIELEPSTNMQVFHSWLVVLHHLSVSGVRLLGDIRSKCHVDAYLLKQTSLECWIAIMVRKSGVLSCTVCRCKFRHLPLKSCRALLPVTVFPPSCFCLEEFDSTSMLGHFVFFGFSEASISLHRFNLPPTSFDAAIIEPRRSSATPWTVLLMINPSVPHRNSLLIGPPIIDRYEYGALLTSKQGWFIFPILNQLIEASRILISSICLHVKSL